jgi:hypothetical protein
MPGPGFNWVFGGSAVQPANVSYLALALSANTTMVWPPQAPTGSVVVARILDVTPSGGGLSLTMPPANQASAGFDCLVTNKGASAFTLLTSTGVTIASIAAGQQYYVYLTDPTTPSGIWNAVLFAASSSSLSAGAIAGVGTIALGATLSPNFVTSTSSSSPLNISATLDRSAQYVWLGGAGTVNLPALSTIPNPPGYFVTLNNKGSGTLQVTPSGSDPIDTVNAAEALNPGFAATYFASPSGWYSFGFLASTKFAFTELVQTVTGGTLTLTQTQAANVVQKYIGTLTSNQTVVFPPIVQVYYVQNATAGAFNLTFKSGSGTQFTLPAGQNAVLFSDGINVVNASNTISGITSLLLSQGSPTVPAIGFTVDPSTGIYQPASGQVAITISGAQNATFRTASLTAPAFIPTTATVPSNGLYLPGANQLGLSVGGVNVTNIDNSSGLQANFTGSLAFNTSGSVLNGGTVAYGFRGAHTFGSAVTGVGIGYSSAPSTAIAAFTMAELDHFRVDDFVKGAGSAATIQAGFICENLANAGTNIGFRGLLSSGANKWNLYMDGTAINYLAGNLLVGSTTDAGVGRPIQATVSTANTPAWISVAATGTTGAAQNAKFYASTVTTNANLQVGVTDNSGTPYASIDVGSAVTALYFDAPVYTFRSQSGAVTFGTLQSAGLTINGTIVGNVAPTTGWGIDLAGAADLVTIANNGTVDLTTGSGFHILYDDAGVGAAYAFSVFGLTVVTNISGTLFSNTLGTASKINFGYNGSTAYRLENKSGVSKNIYVASIKVRAAN